MRRRNRSLRPTGGRLLRFTTDCYKFSLRQLYNSIVPWQLPCAMVQRPVWRISTRCWSMANWQIITWRIPPARICTADSAAEIRKEKFSWTTCRIRTRPFDYIVKAGQTPGPKIIRYRKRRNHAAIFGCWLPPRRLRPVPNGRSGGPRDPRAQQRDDCCRRQEIRLRPWGREVAAKADRWQGSCHRRAVPGDQGTHRRFLDIG